MNNLFTELENQNKQIPLAEILRPKTLEEFLGQSNVVSPNSPILNLLKTQRLFSMIFWGTPGCGKTTLARLIATRINANFIEISAVTSGVKDIKDAVEKAKMALRSGVKTILFIDEIHRYSKTQQDALLPHLENGTLFLIGSTTENPSFQAVPALLSRVQVVRLNSIDDESMAKDYYARVFVACKTLCAYGLRGRCIRFYSKSRSRRCQIWIERSGKRILRK